MNKIQFAVARSSSLSMFIEECNALLARGGTPTGSMLCDKDGINTYHTQAFILPVDDTVSENLTEHISALGEVSKIADNIGIKTRCNPAYAWKLAELVYNEQIDLDVAFKIADR